MSKEDRFISGVHLLYFTCPNCKKRIEVPICADHHYGWWYDEKRFCTYSCLRKFEKAQREQLEQQCAKRYLSERSEAMRLESYEKLYKFLVLLGKGNRIADSWQEAGFVSESAARRAKDKYRRSKHFQNWLKERMKVNE